MRCIIVLPFENAQKETCIWAKEEQDIDFVKDNMRAARCTIAFAATELKRYLEKCINNIDIIFDSVVSKTDYTILLNILNISGTDETYSIELIEKGIIITGESRVAILYGVYEYIKMYGVRWYSPGESGEICPGKVDNMILPKNKKEFSPSMDKGRGFYFETNSMESEDMIIWMARNRLNLGGYRPNIGKLGRKLGMIYVNGGHIFERLLDPDKVLPSGKTIWQEHSNWYGKKDNNVLIEKDNAQGIQFCVAQSDIYEYLSDEIVKLLMFSWKEADRIDIWGFDTWGASCQCEQCAKIGNTADRNVYLASQLRINLDKAYKEGRLNRDVKMVLCAYEGTGTLEGPTNKYPENVLDDLVVYYPINRCYKHNIDDEKCAINKMYYNNLKSWLLSTPHMNVIAGEYYNVSRYEDLPLLFTNIMINDIPAYYRIGSRSIVYMHIPMVNWGIRTLSQVLYAQLAWDVNTNTDEFINEYFDKWYGPVQKEMKEVYSFMEEAWISVTQWRAWSSKSILSMLDSWDGSIPKKELFIEDHFESQEQIIKEGKYSIELMEKALKIIKDIRYEYINNSNINDKKERIVNPAQMLKYENKDIYDARLGEDRRGIIYGLDVMKIMTYLVEYYDALYNNNIEIANAVWESIESITDKLDSYYFPINYIDFPSVGLISRDAYTRSQTKNIVNRCRKWRNNNI